MTSTDTPPTAAPRLIVVSGMSGPGKTIALRTLEDLDYYCVDNLPTALMPAFVAEVARSGVHPRLAVGVDVRNRPGDLHKLPGILADLAEQGIEHQLIFLDARDDVLFKRYSDTRRRHPLSAEGLSLTDAIALERKLLKPVASIAERVVDTGDLNVHQLRRLIATEARHGGARCRCCSNRSRTSAACRPMRISCSTCAACRIHTGKRTCARCPAATPPCANGSKANRKSVSIWRRCANSSTPGCRVLKQRTART